MCGIVGLMSATETPMITEDQRKALAQEVSELMNQLEQGDTKALHAQLQAVGTWLTELPSFSASYALVMQPEWVAELDRVKHALHATQTAVDRGQNQATGFQELEIWNEIGLLCRDLTWRLEEDLLGTQQELHSLFPAPWNPEQEQVLRSYWGIEFILRSLQRLEIRGRDSSGLSLMVCFSTHQDLTRFTNDILASSHADEWHKRMALKGGNTLSICGDSNQGESTTLSFLYKVASEIGSIGQNIKDLREQIHEDAILRKALSTPGARLNPISHTRWASNGIINIFNAHPQGNDTLDMIAQETRLFAVLNGDIDNFSELLAGYQKRTGRSVPGGVTTDAKIIPLLVEEKYRECGDLREAFRQSLQEFEGSFAIAIHHLDEPGRIWLGIGGSGQSLYVGVHPQTLYFASELYGVVEGTSQFVKLDGEREREPGNPSTRGQMLELKRDLIGQPQPFLAWSFDGTPLNEEHLPIKTAQITTRDINIGGYPHFFLKEISESVDSVRKTLHGRFFLHANQSPAFTFNLDETTVPAKVSQALKEGSIHKIFCIGQGTAAIAAMGVAGALRHYLPERIAISATKASELSGHMLAESMEDTLIIAVSQSGTTTDTNRTVDIVRQRGARVLAILNRRNSDLAFKADGVMFTSDGRDVEMSVASTKAFYSQVTAGTLLGLYLGHQSEYLSEAAVNDALKEMTSLPRLMSRVLAQSDRIKEIAQEHALARRYWAVVGSGDNQIAAHEIRIKLSELCYKSMSCDTIEDKKHIDLSAEPLMLVCAAGLDDANLSDTVKEVAIFKAHSSIPIVIASRGAERFKPYAAAVFEVPDTSSHLSPVLTTMVGHLFGYHAACAIDEQSHPMRRVRGELLPLLSDSEGNSTQDDGAFARHSSTLSHHILDILKQLQAPQINSSLEVDTAVGLALSSQRLLYRLLNQESILPNGHKSDSPYELAQQLLLKLTDAIRELSRPIDAIKHQAKTVTVGISRPTPTLKGAIGEIFKELQINPNTVLWRNLSYLIATEPLLNEVTGATLYHVSQLDPDGQPIADSRIFKETAIGTAASITSRTSSNSTLKGSKWLALKDNSVFIGIGRTDGRHIAIIPLRVNDPQEARILLLHLAYDEKANRQDRINLMQARGHVYDQFRAAVTELNLPWNDHLLTQVPIETLFDSTPDRFVEALAKHAGRFDSWMNLDAVPIN
jgi:glucosamine--fructose-6-phosphate aminotransferase (isomerizing)